MSQGIHLHLTPLPPSLSPSSLCLTPPPPSTPPPPPPAPPLCFARALSLSSLSSSLSPAPCCLPLSLPLSLPLFFLFLSLYLSLSLTDLRSLKIAQQSLNEEGCVCVWVRVCTHARAQKGGGRRLFDMGSGPRQDVWCIA
jgi:hypothetical protein